MDDLNVAEKSILLNFPHQVLVVDFLAARISPNHDELGRGKIIDLGIKVTLHKR